MKTIYNGLLALGMSFLSAACGTFINWLFVLRTQTFQTNKAALEKKQEQLDELNAKDDDDKTVAKRKKRLMADIKLHSQNISALSMRGNLVSALFFIIFNRLARNSFNGLVCARIPFVPWDLLCKISHAGVENEDMRDAGYNFVYWLGTMFFRDAISKFLGIEMPKIDFQTLASQNQN